VNCSKIKCATYATNSRAPGDFVREAMIAQKVAAQYFFSVK